jgi:chromosomal replication initiator protein
MEKLMGIEDAGEPTTAIWARVRGRLRNEVGDAAFKSWLKPLTLREVRDGTVRLMVATRFMRDWVAAHYGDRLRELWREEDPSVRAIEISVDPSLAEAGTAAPDEPIDMRGRTRASGPADSLDDDISAPLDPRLTFENFVVGKPNEMAHAAAQRVADAKTVPFNPLFLYGGVGLGKTHLMHAIAHRIRQTKPDKRVIYLSAEKFMYRFIRAMRYKDTMAFKEQFRSVDFLMVDDIQFFSGKDSTQEEFFHTFNALIDENRQVVISADKPPFDLERMEERLRSRLGWGVVADIHPTTYELRLSSASSRGP